MNVGTSPRRHALVIGGGIGGLCTAIGLKRIGWSVSVFERAPELREIGAAVGTLPNGVAALDALGVLDAYKARANHMKSMAIVAADGELLVDLEMERVEREVGYGAYCVHRHEYIAVLSSFLDRDEVFTDHEFSHFEQQSDGVVATFRNGRQARGDILIGADGFRSRVRAQLRGPSMRDLRYCGYVGFRGICAERPTGMPPDERRLMLGAGLQFGYAPMTQDRCYWLATYNSAPGLTRRPAEIRELLLRELALTAWKDVLSPLIEKTPEDGFIQNDIYDYVPDPQWGEGRVTLIGDAAHATSPNQGQGSNMAVEDGAAIAHHLRSHDDPVAALRAFENARYERTKMIVEMSYNAGAQAAETDPENIIRRNALLRQMGPYIAKEGLENLYAYRSPKL